MNLQGIAAEIKMTVEIVRADTGKTDTVELVGVVDQSQLDALINEV
jgi:hypothetical protein